MRRKWLDSRGSASSQKGPHLDVIQKLSWLVQSNGLRMMALAIIGITLAQVPVRMALAYEKHAASTAGHPEARPFDPKAGAKAEVDAALARAKAGQRLAIIVLGANWCHDSRALAGWFGTPRVAGMIAGRYELVYVDVGYRDRNLDIARRFGFGSLKGTPTVLIVNGDGKLLNKREAPKWRNAASRSEDAIYRSFAEFTPP